MSMRYGDFQSVPISRPLTRTLANRLDIAQIKLEVDGDAAESSNAFRYTATPL